MIQVLEQGDIFGKIGKAFGEGLGEKIPEAVSQGLFSRDIGNIQKSNLSPDQLSFQLSKIQTGTPEQRAHVFPLLMRQAQIAAYGEDEEDGQDGSLTTDFKDTTKFKTPDKTIIDTEEVQEKPVQIIGDQDVAKIGKVTPGKEGIGQVTHSVIDADIQKRIAKGPRKITQKEDNRMMRDAMKNRTMDRKEARAFVNEQKQIINDEYQADVNTNIAQKARKENIDSRFMNTLGNLTQKGGEKIWQDIPGRGQENLKNSMYEEINRTGDDDAVSDKWAQIASEYSTADKGLLDLPNIGMFETAPEEIVRDLDLYRENFKKLGLLENYEDRLRSKTGLNIGEFTAAAFSFPLSDPLAQVMDSFPKGTSKLLGTFFTDPEVDVHPKKVSRNSANFPKYSDEQKTGIFESLSDDDSIKSVMLKSYETGRNDKDLKESFKEADKKGVINLTPRQKKELKEADQVGYSLPQILHNMVYGLMGTSYKKSPGDKWAARKGKI